MEYQSLALHNPISLHSLCHSPGGGWPCRCGAAPSAPRPGGSPAPPAAQGCPPGVVLPLLSLLLPHDAAPTVTAQPPVPQSASPGTGSEPGVRVPPAGTKPGCDAAPPGKRLLYRTLVKGDPDHPFPRVSGISFICRFPGEGRCSPWYPRGHPKSEMSTS